MNNRYDVIVSGASAAGLSFVLALAEMSHGSVRIALIDKFSEPQLSQGDFPAYALSAGTRHMMQVLRLWDEISTHAQEVSRIEITDSSLEDCLRPVLLKYNNVTLNGEPATHIVEGENILTSLLKRVRGYKSIDLLFDREVLACEAHRSNSTIHLKGGETFSAKLVISAEGRHSKLRELSGIKTVGWSYHQTGIVVNLAHDLPHEGIAIQHFLPNGPFAILPLLGNRSCVTWSESEIEAKRILSLDDAGFLFETEKRFGCRLGNIRLETKRKSWPLSLRLARSYVADRFALIGDAAHAVHPIAGQGLNLAFRDSAALVEVLVEALRLGMDLGDGEVLSRYERWRRFDSTTSTLFYDALNRLFSTDNQIVRMLRDLGLGVVNRLPPIKQFFIDEAAGLTGKVPRLLQGFPL